MAACCESLDVAAALLDAEPDLLLARTRLGETALHFLVVENEPDAVRWLLGRGDVEIVRRVLAAGADAAVADRAGRTAMHVACRSDDGLAIVHLLLAAGASPHASLVSGKTPLGVAIESGASRVASLLRSRGAKAG